VLIVLIGAALRLYDIGSLPPGLYRDEAFYGLDGVRVLHGQFAIFFAANNGREGLFMYLLAASMAIFGQTPFALRLVPAIVGTLTIVAIYATGRRMFSHRVGVLSAAILAITFWHLALSRVAFRAILLPLTLCALLALIFAALRTNELRPRLTLSALAGATFGLTVYTYTSGQFVLPLVMLFALSLVVGLKRELFTRRSELVVYRRRASAIAFTGAALVILAPLFIWLTRHADLYFNRAGQVSILSPSINHGDLAGTLTSNVGKAIGMFAFMGDRIWRHNLAGRPVFDGFLAIAFFIGLATCVWRWLRSWQSRYGSEILGVETNIAPQFLLLWLIVFLVPTILAEDTPHFLRAIGALPAACLIAAVGLETALAWASRRGLISSLSLFLRRTISPPAFVASVVLALSGINTVTDYFNDYVKRPITGYWLETNNVALTNTIKRAALPSSNIWVEDRLTNDTPALDFLVGRDAFTIVRNENGQAVTYDAQDHRVPLSQWPRQGGQVTLIADPNHDWSPIRNALPLRATLQVTVGPLAQADHDVEPHRAFITVQAAPSGTPGQALAHFEQGISLVKASVRTVSSDGEYQVSLTWTTAEPIPDDYALFVHWVRSGQAVAQVDTTPGSGYLPLPTWRPGDWIEDSYILAGSGSLQPGDELQVGLYHRGDNRRLNVLDATGKAVATYVIIPHP